MSKLIPRALSVIVVILVSGALLTVAFAQSPYVFTRDLSVGMSGADVMVLQQFLNTHGAPVSASGPGSLQNETTYFGEKTRVAIALWQIVAGISPPVGYFGTKSRSRIKELGEVLAEEEKSALSPQGSRSIPPKQNDTLMTDALSTVDPRHQEMPAVEKSWRGLPTRLIIAKINIDTAIEHVGLTPEGAIGVPKGPVNTAWFNLGPRPGETGSAVISGHFGWKDGIPAVFDNLYQLTKGDTLSVQDERGATTMFVVREMRTYGENDEASDVFNSHDGKAHLNLITCEGVWNKEKKSYSGRLIVFTDSIVE